MLAKKFHLSIQDLTPERFKKVSVGGKTTNKYFIIKTAANNLSFSRFGVITSRKISKKAVKRNLIKRTVFDFVRLNKLYQPAGKDVLIIVLPAINQLTKSEINNQLKLILYE